MEHVEPIRTAMFDQLRAEIYRTDREMGRAVALKAREIIGQAIAERGEANITLSVGNSHVAFLETLRDLPGIEWSGVNVFTVDNSIGMPADRPDVGARLRATLTDIVKPRSFVPVPALPKGTQEVEKVCWEYADLLRKHPQDLVVAGFGESGHMALNEPPYTTFDDPAWVKAVRRVQATRMQSVAEGRFESPDQVPDYAITLTIPALLATKHLLCEASGPRKADIVRACMLEPVSEDRPGSILRNVPYAQLFLDQESAAKLPSV